VENKPVGESEFMSKPPRSPRYRLIRRLSVVLVVLALVASGYLLYSKLTSNTAKNNSNAEKVLTLSDLDKPGVELNSKTSNASVENLTKELKAKIEKQITDKQNPIETVRTLVGLLCNTVNANRQNQCIDYITDFLTTKMDALKLSSELYGQPDELQITYWRAQFYVDLENNYKLIMDNKFTGSDSKPLNTTAEQLKYVKLYLAIAQNPANWGEPQISQEGGHTWYYYEYKNTNDFIELRKQLEAGGAK